MKSHPRNGKNKQPAPPVVPIRMGRVTIRGGAIDLDPDFAAVCRDAVHTDGFQKALNSLIMIDELARASQRCLGYLESSLAAGDVAAVERFGSLLLALDHAANLSGHSIRKVWPPVIAGPTLVDPGLTDLEGDATTVERTYDPVAGEDDDGLEDHATDHIDDDAELAAAEELARERAALVAGGAT